MTKFSAVGDKLYAVLNWDSRSDSGDVAVLKYLSDEEAETYRAHRSAGLSDTSIFQIMFPPPPDDPADHPPKHSKQFSEVDGALYVVMNWDTRHSEEDVAIIKYMTLDEVALYRRLRHEGLEDREIFERLFPRHPHMRGGGTRVIQIDLSSLTKRQLLRLIEAELDLEMPSLERSSRDDLEKLLLKLHRGA
jgi:hypothetical protein